LTRKHVWGIDIGSSAVRAVKLVRTQEGIRLADYDIRELSYLGRDDERILEAVRKALIGLAGRKSLIGERVVVSVSGSLSFQRVVKLPPCPLGKIPEMMRYEAQQQIPFSLDDVIWDYQLVSDPADVSQGRKVALFAVKREVLDPVLRFCREAMMRVVGVQLTHIALYNYLNWELHFEKPVALLDVGARYTGFAIFDTNGDLWVRPLPVAGSHLTEMVAERRRLSFVEAEQEKISALAGGGEEAVAAVMPGIRNLLAEARRSLGFFRSQAAGRDVEKVYLSGRGLSFPGALKLIGDELGVPVAEITYPQKIAYSLVGPAEVFFEDCRQLSVAFGLALQGLGETRFTTNLLPPSLQLDNVLAEKRTPVALGILVLWIAAVVSLVVVNMRLDRVSADIAVIRKAVDEIERDDAELRAVLDEIPPLALQARNLASFLHGRDAPYRAANRIVSALDSVRSAGSLLWLASLSIRDVSAEKLQEWAVSLDYPGITGVEDIITWKAGRREASPEEQKIFDRLEPCRVERWYALTLTGEAAAGKGDAKLRTVERFRDALAGEGSPLSAVSIATDWTEDTVETPSGPLPVIRFTITARLRVPPYYEPAAPGGEEVSP